MAARSLEQVGEEMRPSPRRAIEDRLACRTEGLGGQRWPGDHGGQEPDVSHSCRHRRGPTCHRLDTAAWLAERRQERLPVPSCQVVFTVPQAWREIIRRPQKDLYDSWRRAAAQALSTLAADPHDGGGLIGVLRVLHTWTRTLASHPHGHGLVPAGGVSADRTAWRPARTSSLVPVQALSTLCRGRFRALVRQERPDLTMPEAVWTKGWRVSCNPPVQGSEQGLHDLGRSVHRIALTKSRLVSSEDGHVCFRSQDAQDQRWKPMTLPALECIRRLLQQVWPQGFHTVRSSGRWSPVHRPLLHQLQRCLARPAPDPPPTSPAPESPPTDAWCPPLRAGQTCPHCGQGLLVVVRLRPRHQRGPP